jgi:hypothetical protein
MRGFFMLAVFAMGFGFAACDETLEPLLNRPVNLAYELDPPTGEGEPPAGALLFWDPVLDGALQVYRVYSRFDDGAAFDLRGSTTSASFHDVGIPDLDYFVVAVDVNGVESDPSDVVRIDERLRLSSPDDLTSTSLDGAVYLAWSDNPFQSEPDGFRQYRVYSASYSLDDQFCGESWAQEGTTVAPEFLVGAMSNGVSRCFAVTAESIEGWESLWSPIRADTPRPDARNELVFAFQADAGQSGFRFDLGGQLGAVLAGDRSDLDFRIDRDPNGDFFFVPVRAGTGVVLYSDDPIDDLTSIDIAPDVVFDTSPLQAAAGFGYVFAMDGGDGFARFGGVRVTHVGTDFVIFDWSYQTDPGNPELSIHGGLAVTDLPGVRVTTRGR